MAETFAFWEIPSVKLYQFPPVSPICSIPQHVVFSNSHSPAFQTTGLNRISITIRYEYRKLHKRFRAVIVRMTWVSTPISTRLLKLKISKHKKRLSRLRFVGIKRLKACGLSPCSHHTSSQWITDFTEMQKIYKINIDYLLVYRTFCSRWEHQLRQLGQQCSMYIGPGGISCWEL